MKITTQLLKVGAERRDHQGFGVLFLKNKNKIGVQQGENPKSLKPRVKYTQLLTLAMLMLMPNY